MAEHDRKIRDSEARSLYAAGKSDGQIAEVFGVKKQAVLKWRKRHELAANRPRVLPAYQRPKLKAAWMVDAERCNRAMREATA